MSYAIKHALSEVVWSDGTTISLPPISRSGNGWVYRPPEAIGRGTGKSFGKGTTGDNEAKLWLSNQIQKAFVAKDWELPNRIPKLKNLPSISDGTVQVGWNHPVFGVTYVDLTYTRSYAWRSSKRSLTMTLYYNVLVDDFVARNIKFHDGLTATKTWSTEAEKDSELLVFYEKFRQDPWGFAQRQLQLTPAVADLIAPPVELPAVDYSGKDVNDDITAWYRMRGNVDLLFEDNAQRISIESLPLFNRALEAFAHLGLDVHVGWEYRRDGNNVPSSITIEFPTNDEVGTQERHKIKIQSTGISIECGYVKDEERYLEYTKRKAVSFFEEVFEEEWNATEIQL